MYASGILRDCPRLGPADLPFRVALGSGSERKDLGPGHSTRSKAARVSAADSLPKTLAADDVVCVIVMATQWGHASGAEKETLTPHRRVLSSAHLCL